MGITKFKLFIWGGILSDLRSEITFKAPLAFRRKTKFLTVYLMIYPNENFEYSYPLSVHKWEGQVAAISVAILVSEHSSNKTHV